MVDKGNPRLLRTGVLAERLSQRGHEVTWWTSAFDHYAKVHRASKDATYWWKGVQVRMLHSVGYQRNVSLRRFIEHAGVARKFSREARCCDPPDIILCSLPTIELSSAAVKFGLEKRIPVLLDIRDLWPDVLIDVVPRRLRWLSRLLLHRSSRAASLAMRGAAGIIGISSGYLDWALRYANRPRRSSDAMYPLGYVAPVPSLSGALAASGKLEALGVDETKTLIWYIGSFGRQYDLAPVIGAASALRAAGNSTVQFVISGDGEFGSRWRLLAAGLSNVVFTGWIGSDEIHWLRRKAAIGLQPYAFGAPQGLANKLFEYLSAGIPVLSSLAGENERLIADHRCGLSYAAGSTTDFLRQLSCLLERPEERYLMGQRGQALFERQFDGKVVFEGLVGHLEAVASNAGSIVS